MIDFKDFHWSSNWDGDEVGYENIPVVALYSLKAYPEINVYIDIEKGVILDAWYVTE